MNQVILGLVRDYEVQVSFNDQKLSGYRINFKGSFDSPEDAIAFLLKDYPLEIDKRGKVIIIYGNREAPEKASYRLTGSVSDVNSGESLPYSHLIINRKGIVTDFNGKFSYVSDRDSIFDVSVSYLGYYHLDTLLQTGIDHQLELAPSIIGLKEVVIRESYVENSGQAGEEPGVLRLNHKIAYRLPGNGDNSIFNFLRLQPGILAAGEQSSEMIIWGSYTGHSQVIFDGFTVYGLKNFNDNISFVNPYMSKDIKVMKGGYSADYGDRVGGIVEISGYNGITNKPSINLNINNMTVNGMASVPIKEKASLTFAYRHTYYNMYDAQDLKIISKNRKNSTQSDISIYPDYMFRDINLKYAGSTVTGNPYFLSLYQGRDQFSYNVDQERNNTSIGQNAEEENRQLGGTFFYGKTWKSGNISHYSISASGLDRTIYEKQEITRIRDGRIVSNSEVNFNNRVREYAMKNRNYFSLSERHRLETGWSYLLSQIGLGEDSSEKSLMDSQSVAHRITLYVQNEMFLTERVKLKPGFRIETPLNLGKIYVEPRIQLSFDLTNQLKMNGAWGIYHQFISETSVVDELGNYRYFWAVCDNDEVPVLTSQHVVGGITHHQPGLTIGVETFYKTVEGITRYVNLLREGLQTVFQGQGRVYGTDLLIKKYFGRHEIWTSYTISKTEEYFPYFNNYEFRYAPQDQRHEIKGALLLNFRPFYFSANYVYGSGLAIRQPFFNNNVERQSYNRLDVAAIYRYSVRDYHFEGGISILNLFNTENIKYSNFIRVPDAQNSNITIHAEAVPFTPTVYLNISF